MKPEIDYSLYLVTDRDLMSTKSLENAVEQAILGGATVVQLREKNCSSLDFYNTALSMREITDNYKVPLIINDSVDIALAVNADGIHVGQSDIPAKIIRKIIGNNMILGVSASTLEEAVTAKMDGADYVGVGAMYATGTKTNARITTKDELLKIRKAVDIPIVVIGGINMDTISDFTGTGIDGIAVVSAIISQKNIKRASMELKKYILEKIKARID